MTAPSGGPIRVSRVFAAVSAVFIEGGSMRFDDLAHSSNRDLEIMFRSAASVAPDMLAGAEWRGYNMSAFTRLLGIQKFVKGFFTAGDRVEGYNIPAVQNGLAGPWLQLPSAQTPRRYAFFTVAPVDPASRDNLYPMALLLNYGASLRNPPVGAERLIRDYLVQPDPHSPDLLLGKAYFALGPWRLFSNFFIIERLRPTDWVPGETASPRS